MQPDAASAPHFSAYSFVDRIVEFEPGKRARGTFAIPAHLCAFPAALVAEAVGQLAAWAAMDRIGFRGRPVAGLATETRFLGEAKPGDTLTLAVELSDCDDEAVAYNGHASVNGKPVIELVDCLGPMLPVTDFDDPTALRERLALLRGQGARPGRFGGIPELPVRVTHRVAGAELRATLDVPADAPFFADHFPRRPVFPATLLLDTMMRLALDTARDAPASARARPLRVTHVKMRSFIVPSQRLDVGVELAPASDGIARAHGSSSHWSLAMSSRSTRRRVAITGIGLVTPVGNDVATTWTALDGAKSGAAPITLFDASGFTTRIAAEVKGFDEGVITAPRKFLKFGNRSHRFALAAAEEAMRDAGIEPTEEDGARWGCAVGTGMMGVDFSDLAAVQRHSAPDGQIDPQRLLTDAAAADPLAFCRSQSTAGVALLTRRFGIRGYATSVHTACASGGQAIGTALKLIRRGVVDRALAGGFDSMISPVGLAGFCLLSAVSTDNDTPERASRPFDATRNGFVLGEGAGFVVLEEWEQAMRRGARIYAELAGDGNSLSSYRITDSPPDGDGPIQSMRAALADAGATPTDVDYINAHGTSTGMNDRSETAAIHAVFGDDAKRVSVSSTKSSMGHLIAAAGAVEVVICALAIDRSEMPVNANYREFDPDCDLNLVLEKPRRQKVRMTLSNSFGFGGSNSCVVLRSPELVGA